jgi:transposase
MPPSRPFTLSTERLGPLPLLDHFLGRLGIDAALDRAVPTTDRRARLPAGKALGVLLRSILVEREPIYRQPETVAAFEAAAFGLTEAEARALGDDQVGRALDRLFDADRGALVTEIVVALRRRLALDLGELHNDSTTVRFSGQYREASGRRLRGKRAPYITYGYSKDHRPDLKQLLYILTTSTDGVPVQFRVGDGNTSDSTTHIETWETLRALAGRPDFLYVADSKLCAMESLEHLDRNQGRFVTVLPRSRQEDAEFRRWLQTHEPEWQLVVDRPHPRREDGPRDRWWVFRAKLPSREGWPVIWIHSALLRLAQHESRRDRIARAGDALDDLARALASRRTRRRERSEVENEVAAILERHQVRRYVRSAVKVEVDERFVQTRPGRPGKQTHYRRLAKLRLKLEWTIDEAAVAYDQKSDGMYPLLTNDRSLTPEPVLEAHKRQPTIEKRFEQLKDVLQIAPVFLKNEGRIEAFFLVHFLALLLSAVIERQLRQAMKRDEIDQLPLYPEERSCRRPTTEQVFRLFARVERHRLSRRGRPVQVFQPELTDLQRQILELLGVPLSAYVGRD